MRDKRRTGTTPEWVKEAFRSFPSVPLDREKHITELQKQVIELEAQIEAVRNCKVYIEGEDATAFMLADDVLEAIGEKPE